VAVVAAVENVYAEAGEDLPAAGFDVVVVFDNAVGEIGGIGL